MITKSNKKLFRNLRNNLQMRHFSMQHKYLITGCSSQIGAAIVPKIIKNYGEENVILSDETKKGNPYPQGIFERLDVTDVAHYKYLMEKHQITYIVHLAGVQSAFAEKNPYLAMKTNFEGVINALDMAKEYSAKIFIPSSIAVFGPNAPKKETPISVPLSPTTIYGVSKHFMENMGNYYHFKYKIDFRSIRLPGIISPKDTEAYMGTTDYASEIFFYALRGKEYPIPLKPHRRLPFVYLDDIVNGSLQLMQEDENLLSTRVYNIQALSFTCEELVHEIKKLIPNFKYRYEIDFRDEIAESWPESLNDDLAKSDWKWDPKFTDLDTVVNAMIHSVKANRI